jgi:hypothetical protein
MQVIGLWLASMGISQYRKNKQQDKDILLYWDPPSSCDTANSGWLSKLMSKGMARMAGEAEDKKMEFIAGRLIKTVRSYVNSNIFDHTVRGLMRPNSVIGSYVRNQ